MLKGRLLNWQSDLCAISVSVCYVLLFVNSLYKCRGVFGKLIYFRGSFVSCEIELYYLRDCSV